MQISEIEKILSRRVDGEPISKIFGKRDFYNSIFSISNDFRSTPFSVLPDGNFNV